MITAEEVAERLAQLGPLERGWHQPNDSKACVMEAVSFVAGEPWSANPACSDPVISTFLRNWNDTLPDDERDVFLRPLIPLLIGTRGSAELEARRSLMAADWLIRTHTPAWLRLAGLSAHAEALANHPEITRVAQVPSIRPAINAAKRYAVAARDAWVGPAAATAIPAAAAGDAAWDASRAAAGAAVGAAAGTALEAVWAAYATAGFVLAATENELQRSALSLVLRMIEAQS